MKHNRIRYHRPTAKLYNQLRITRSIRQMRADDRACVVCLVWCLLITILTAVLIWAMMQGTQI